VIFNAETGRISRDWVNGYKSHVDYLGLTATNIKSLEIVILKVFSDRSIGFIYN
jgi:hypothetical protein